MNFGRTKRTGPVDVGALTLERLRDRWVGYINGYVSAVIAREHPSEPFEVRLSRAYSTPLKQDELQWLYKEVRGSICGRIGYSLSPGSIEQRSKDTGNAVVEFRIIITAEPDHPMKIFN